MKKSDCSKMHNVIRNKKKERIPLEQIYLNNRLNKCNTTKLMKLISKRISTSPLYENYLFIFYHNNKILFYKNYSPGYQNMAYTATNLFLRLTCRFGFSMSSTFSRLRFLAGRVLIFLPWSRHASSSMFSFPLLEDGLK